jgi:hypothetical protein
MHSGIMELMDQVKYSNHVKPVEAIRSAELLNLSLWPLSAMVRYA